MRKYPKLTMACFLVSVLLLFFTLAGVVIAQDGQPGTQAPASPGSGWEVQSKPGDAMFYSVEAVDTSTAWVGGLGSGFQCIVHRTVDGGATWLPQNLGISAGMISISAADASTLYAAGMKYLPDALNVGLKSVDGGGTWNTIYQSPSTYIMDVLAMDDKNVWAVGTEGQPSDCTGFIFKSVDGVSGYVKYFLPQCAFMKISAASPDVLWVTGTKFGVDGTILLKTTDGGDSWEDKTPGPGQTYVIRDVAAVNPTTAWVIGLGLGGNGAILKTTDGGSNWVPQYTFSGCGVIDISCVDAETAWVLGGDIGLESVILKTCDGGANWVSQDLPEPCALMTIKAVDECTAWAVGRKGMLSTTGIILKTSDGGDPGPDVVSVSPQAGVVGTEVTIAGCDFGDTQDPSSFVSFGGVPATQYPSWTDKEIVVEVPAGVSGKVEVKVTTPEGTSNPKDFTVVAPVGLSSVSPKTAMQFAFTADLTMEGSGFQPGATVSLVKGTASLGVGNVKLISPDKLTCSVWIFGADTGAYDVVVKNPDGGTAVLPGEFTVTTPCGTGSGSALLVLGLCLGLLSLAGSARLRRRRRR